MGKKIKGYQATDGKVFIGRDAKGDMERHEYIIGINKRIQDAIGYAHKVFDVPADEFIKPRRNEICDDVTEKERAFLEEVGTEYDFDDFIEQIVRMREFNKKAFSKFVVYLEKCLAQKIVDLL
jgi:hypothetical protein